MTLGPLIKKELRIILRSRLLLVVLVLYPLIIVSILGFAFSKPNQRVPLAIVNKDVDAFGRPNTAPITSPIEGETSVVTVSSAEIIRSLLNFTDIHSVDEDTARTLLRNGEVQAIVMFPEYFVRDIANFQSSGRLTVILDQSDPVRAKYMEVIVRGQVQAFQEQVVREKVRMVVNVINRSLGTIFNPDDLLYPGFKGTHDSLEDMIHNNPAFTQDNLTTVRDAMEFLRTIMGALSNSANLVESVAEPVSLSIQQEKYGILVIRDLIIPAALGLSIFWTGALATSSLVVYEREAAAYTRLRITLATWGTIYGSKIIVTLSIVVAQALAILFAALIFWHSRMDSPTLTILVMLASAAASMGIGIFVAGISRDVNGTVLLSVLVTFPMLFLSGLFYPVDFMPKGAQALAHAFPLTYAVEGLRGTMFRGFGIARAGPIILKLLLFALGLTGVGVWMGRRMESRR